MQQITTAAMALLGVDGAGLMLADADGQLRWATASDQPTQILEEGEERLGEGPCVNAFAEHAPMVMRVRPRSPIGAGSPMWSPVIGTLDLYTAFAHRTRIERAKGMVLLQEGVDDAEAFERLRSAAGPCGGP